MGYELTSQQTKDDIARHHRAVARDLGYIMPEHVTRTTARLGETTGVLEGDHSLERALKYKIWMRDSILWSLECAARGEIVEMMRGYAQVRLYEGQIDGMGIWPHNSVTSDATSLLRAMLEYQIRRVA